MAARAVEVERAVTDQPSKQVVMQRVRNRIIEHLTVVASYAEQLDYQARVPYVNVPTEIFCGWADDWVPDGWQGDFGPPVFTPDELAAVAQFDETIKAVRDVMPEHLPSLDLLLDTEPWECLRLAAQEALEVFSHRGKLSEDIEVG